MMLELGTKPGLLELPLRIKLPALLSTSPTTKASGPVEVSSLIAWSGIEERNGGSLTGSTVTRKERLARLLEAPPSFTWTVTIEVPTAFVTVLNVKVPV